MIALILVNCLIEPTISFQWIVHVLNVYVYRRKSSKKIIVTFKQNKSGKTKSNRRLNYWFDLILEIKNIDLIDLILILIK